MDKNGKVIVEGLNSIAMNLCNMDQACEVPLHYQSGNDEDGALFAKLTRHKGIFNLGKNRISNVVSTRYQLIQHSDVMRAVIETLGRLNLDVEGLIVQDEHRIRGDLVFKKEGLSVKDGAKGVKIGFRVLNSYDKSWSFRLEMFGYRLICKSGMALGNTMGIREVTLHVGEKKTYEKICWIVEGFIKDVIESHNTLQAYVDSMIADSTEWQFAEDILTRMFKVKKHREAILERLEKKPIITRWELYNALTNYISHGNKIKPGVQSWLELCSQRFIRSTFKQLENPIEVMQ